jgi:hypothetical protein
VPRPQASLVLDPNDEFEAAVIELVRMHRTKSVMYGSEGDSLGNFYDAANALAITPLGAAIAFHAKHGARLTKWLRDGQPEDAPGVDDMFVDRAVYSIIELCLWHRRKKNGKAT